MKNLLKNLSIENISRILKNIAQRFPVSVIFLLIAASALITGITLEDFSNELYTKIIVTSILSFFLSTGISLHANTHIKENSKKLLLQLITIVFAVIYYFYIGNLEGHIYATLTFSLLFGFLGFIFVGAYMPGVIKNEEAKNMHYFPYFEIVFYAFLLATGLGLLLSILGGIAYISIGELFDLYSNDLYDKLIGYWLVIANVIIAPIFGLYKLPIDFLQDDEYNEENDLGILSITPEGIIKYIFLPAIIVYFIILYAYSIKLLINFGDWPKGQVSWFVIIFCIIGYFTYIFSYPFERNSTPVQKYRTYFPLIAIPQIIILFYAIYLRIHSYGLTTNRYLVVLFGLWLLGLSAYYIISKNKKLIYIPATIAIISLVTSAGPWSTYNLPIKNQESKLNKLLMQENIMLEDGTLDLQDPKISQKNSVNIKSTIEYLCDQDDCEKMSKLFDIKPEDIEFEFNEYKTKPDHWDIKNAIYKKLQLPVYTSEYNEEYQNHHIDFYNDDLKNINIEGYKTLQEINLYSIENNKLIIGNQTYNFDLSPDEIEKLINKDTPSFDVSDNKTIVIISIRYNKDINSLEYLRGYLLSK